VVVALVLVIGVGGGVSASAATFYYDANDVAGLQPGDAGTNTAIPNVAIWNPSEDGTEARVIWVNPGSSGLDPNNADFRCGGTSVFTCGTFTVGALSVSNASTVEIVTGNTSRYLTVSSFSISGASSLTLNTNQMSLGSGWSTPTLDIVGASRMDITGNKKKAFTWAMGDAALAGDGGSINFNVAAGTGSANVTLELGTITKSGGGTFTINKDAANPTQYRLGGSGDNLDINTVAADDAISISALLDPSSAVTKTGSGTLTLSADNNYSGATAVNGGTLLINGDQTLAMGAVTVADGGTLGGTGTIGGAVDVEGNGILSPGASIGTLSTGSVAMGNGAIYQFDIGTSPTNADEVVVVAGEVTFDTAWTVELADGGSGAPLADDKFYLFSYDASLATLVTPTFDPGSTDWNVSSASIGNDSTGIYMTAISSSILGDADENGVVNAADYMVLKRNMGQSVGGAAADGDFNDNGTVDYADLQLLIGNFDAVSGGAPAVPEPATLFVLMAAGLPALLKRRRRRS